MSIFLKFAKARTSHYKNTNLKWDIMYQYEKWIDYMNVEQSTNKSGFPKWTQPRRWNPFSDFAFDRKYEIRILKSKSRFPNRTQPEIYVFGFFFFTVRLRNPKKGLKNCP